MGWKAKLKELGLTDEQINEVVPVVEDSYKEYVLKSDYDSVVVQNKDYKSMIKDRDTQLEDLKVKAEGNEDFQNKIKDLEEINKKSADDYEAKLHQQAFDFALDNALRDNKVKNIQAVKALLSKDNLKFHEGNLYGFDEQIAKIKESDAYLFDTDVLVEGNPPAPPTFPQPGGGNPPASPTDVELGKSLAEKFNKKMEG